MVEELKEIESTYLHNQLKNKAIEDLLVTKYAYKLALLNYNYIQKQCTEMPLPKEKPTEIPPTNPTTPIPKEPQKEPEKPVVKEKAKKVEEPIKKIEEEENLQDFEETVMQE